MKLFTPPHFTPSPPSPPLPHFSHIAGQRPSQADMLLLHKQPKPSSPPPPCKGRGPFPGATYLHAAGSHLGTRDGETQRACRTNSKIPLTIVRYHCYELYSTDNSKIYLPLVVPRPSQSEKGSHVLSAISCCMPRGYRRLSDSSVYIDEVYKSLKNRKFPLNRIMYVIPLYMHSSS